MASSIGHYPGPSHHVSDTELGGPGCLASVCMYPIWLMGAAAGGMMNTFASQMSRRALTNDRDGRRITSLDEGTRLKDILDEHLFLLEHLGNVGNNGEEILLDDRYATGLRVIGEERKRREAEDRKNAMGESGQRHGSGSDERVHTWTKDDLIDRLPKSVMDDDKCEVFANFIQYVGGRELTQADVNKILRSGIEKRNESNFDRSDIVLDSEVAKNSLINLLDVHERWEKMHKILSKEFEDANTGLRKVIHSNIYLTLFRKEIGSKTKEKALRCDHGNGYVWVSKKQVPEGTPGTERVGACDNNSKTREEEDRDDEDESERWIREEMWNRSGGGPSVHTDYEDFFDRKEDGIKNELEVRYVNEWNDERKQELGWFENRSFNIKSKEVLEVYNYYQSAITQSIYVLNTLFEVESILLTKLRAVSMSNRNKVLKWTGDDGGDTEREVDSGVDDDLVDEVMELIKRICLVVRYVDVNLRKVYRVFDEQKAHRDMVMQCFSDDVRS